MEERRKLKLQAEWRAESDPLTSRPLGVRGVIMLNNTELWRSPTLHDYWGSSGEESALDDAEEHAAKVLKALFNSMPEGAS